jgi:hypothetical protein
MDLDSKAYSWAYVTGDRLLHTGPCELLCAEMDPSANSGAVTLYDGRGTGGQRIIGIQAKYQTNRPFKPKVPVYCMTGLYVDVGDNVTGVFVQWRGL